MDGYVDIDYDRCDSCGKCVSSCPKGVLQTCSLRSRRYVAPVRWFLCDGCKACMGACDRQAVEAGPLSPSFEEHTTCYFREAGPKNTLQICRLVAEEVKAGAKHVVVSSTSGSTALLMARELQGLKAKLLVFTIPPAWSKIYPYPSIPQETRKMIEDLGAKVMDGVSPAISCGPETINCSTSYGTLDRKLRKAPSYVVWELLHGIGGQGLPTAVDAIFTAVKEGEVPLGSETIGVGGTGCGADTAILMRATPYEEMLSGPLEHRFNIIRIIAAPAEKRWYW